mmetsp:Transcript_29316/g.82708  ORF Transcript_29316/g.82708 Transcript_29316/m.82708 type:complete len:178 (-) Transcript_29316:329-862(-)
MRVTAWSGVVFLSMALSSGWLLDLCMACKLSGDWRQATHSEQWLAAGFVVEGIAIQTLVTDDHSSLTDSVLLESLLTTKGTDLQCTTILVTGFRSSAACGLDPPPLGSPGTYYLCSLTRSLDDGGCTAELNTAGDAHVGLLPGISLGYVDPSTAPATCPQEADVCLSVDACKVPNGS